MLTINVGETFAAFLCLHTVTSDDSKKKKKGSLGKKEREKKKEKIYIFSAQTKNRTRAVGLKSMQTSTRLR